MSCLRNSIACDPGVFLIFSKFWFFGLLGGKRAENGPKWQKILSVTYSISQEPYIIWLSFMVPMCKKIISLGVFLFFRIFIFRVVKGQKMVHNDKKFCALRFVSQEPYIIWLSFMLHLCKMIKCPGNFFICLKILIFWVVRGGGGR